jgi:hypothetical protein
MQPSRNALKRTDKDIEEKGNVGRWNKNKCANRTDVKCGEREEVGLFREMEEI